MNRIVVFILAAGMSVAVINGCSMHEKVITPLVNPKNADIGVMTLARGESIAAARFLKAQVKSFDDLLDAVAGMKFGQLDAIHRLYPAAVQFLKKNPTAQGNTFSSFFAGIASSIQNNLVLEKRYLLIWDGLKTTVVISILATVLGTLLGALVCFMRMSKQSLLNLPARVYIAVLRGTPVLVLLMVIFYVVFASVNINPILVAVIAFAMNFAAYVGEIFRTGIEGVDKGQTEAGIAMGFTRFRTFLFIVLPQTLRRILPVYKGEFISLVKMTSIVGYIAVQDLTKASDIIRSRTFDAFFPLILVAILYFAISWFLIQSLEYLERRTNPRIRRRKAITA
jgi:His/Glu/Gln/Arg/opine family amino acid ABC transporter permease subunit